MGTTLRVGIAGAGLMGYWHAAASRAAGGSVTAVVDRDPDAAGRLARNHPGASSFTSLEEMLGNEVVDVLHVCTNTDSHHEIALAAIQAGAHVLVEKPMAATAADSEDLIVEAGAHGVSVCPVHQFLFQDGVRAAHVALPMIGDLVHLQATFCTAGAEGLPDETADRLIADILPHPLSLAQFFLPAALPERWTTLRSVAGELRASCATAGTTLSFVISTHGRPTLCAFDVVGSAGSIHLDLYHGYAVIEPGAVSRARKLARPFAHAMRTATAATFNSGRRLWRGEAAYPGLWQLVDAFYGSIRSHGPAPIPAHEAIEIAHLRDRLAEDAGLLDRNIALGRTA